MEPDGQATWAWSEPMKERAETLILIAQMPRCFNRWFSVAD